jgi:hypothetical protein
LKSSHQDAYVGHTVAKEQVKSPELHKSHIYIPKEKVDLSSTSRDAHNKKSLDMSRAMDPGNSKHHFSFGNESNEYTTSNYLVAPPVTALVTQQDNQLLKSSLPIGGKTSAYAHEIDNAFLSTQRQDFIKKNATFDR